MSFWVHRKVLREVKNFNQMKSHYMGSGNLVRKGQGTNSFLSYLEQETDIVIYFPNKIYEKPLTEEEDLSFYEADEDNDILIKENNGNDFESNQFNNVIEGLIISMLTTNGPKSAEKIYTLLKTVYKTNVTYPYNESQTKEILRGMLMKQRIAYNGELYSVVN